MARPKKEVGDYIDSELESVQPLEENIVQEEKKVMEEVRPIGLEIKSKFEERAKEVEKAYRSLEEADGSVTIRNPVCGGSVRYKSFESFPRSNTPCTCGKVGHYMIRFSYL